MLHVSPTLDDWVPRFPDPHNRALNARLVPYFYKGIEPEPLHLLVQHFPGEHISDVFQQFRVQCTASVVEMVNIKTEKSFRECQFRARVQQQIPEPSRPLGGERRAKKTDSAGAKKNALLEEPLPPIFDCDNCGGTHKSMNCKSKCRLCKSKGLDDDHIQFHCPQISNAIEKKKNQLPRKATDSAQRSVKSATSGPKRPAGSIISAITQDDDSFAEEDSEVRHDYSVWVDTCASDVYTPSISDLDPDSFSFHSRVTDRLNVEQADGTKLVSSGVGTLAGAPAYVMPDMSYTLLGANVVCKLGNIMQTW